MNRAIHAACISAWNDTMRTMLDVVFEPVDTGLDHKQPRIVAVLQFGGGRSGAVQLLLPVTTAVALVNRHENADHGSLHASTYPSVFKLLSIYSGNLKRALSGEDGSATFVSPPWLLTDSEQMLNLDAIQETTTFKSLLGSLSLTTASCSESLAQ